MDLTKTGKLISKLRREQGLTQKDVANRLGICSKTVSKWETGKGFPDISLVSQLSKIFNVDISKLLDGELPQIKQDSGNIKKTKFYVCPSCGNIATSISNTEITCCGRSLKPLIPREADVEHMFDFQKIEDDYFITFNHPMSKSHYITFISYVRFDRVLTVKLYPEQSGEVRFPQMRGGKMYGYCNVDGLFEIKI